MQNKILIFFFISLSAVFNYCNVFANEEFNFDVTEIEILDNGNKIKGLNRGKITSNNGLIIDANEFEYNKNSNILNAKGNVKIEYPLKKYKIFAEKISYLKNQNIIIAENKSKLIDEEGRVISAKKLS